MSVIDVGDQVFLSTAPVAAGSTTPIDATVALLVTKPDASTTSPAVVHAGTGSYTSVVTVDQSGTWTYTWTWSGAAVGVDPGQFTVEQPPRVLVASFAELKKHLNRTDTLDDDELRTYLEAATDFVEWRLGGPLSVRTFTELVTIRSWWIQPTKRPLVSVISLTPELGSLLDSSAYVVDTGRNMIRIRWGALAGYYTLVYRAGLAVIPERVKLAGLIIAAHLWEVQNGGGGLPFGGDHTVATYGHAFAIPNRAEELLAPSVVPGFA